MKKTNTSEILGKLFFGLFLLGVILIPELGFAQAGSGMTFLTLTSNQTFIKIITFGLGLVAGYAWFTFFTNFNLQSALTAIITPGALTFLTFKWADIIKAFFSGN